MFFICQKLRSSIKYVAKQPGVRRSSSVFKVVKCSRVALGARYQSPGRTEPKLVCSVNQLLSAVGESSSYVTNTVPLRLYKAIPPWFEVFFLGFGLNPGRSLRCTNSYPGIAKWGLLRSSQVSIKANSEGLCFFRTRSTSASRVGEFRDLAL